MQNGTFFRANMACRKAQICVELSKNAQEVLLCNTPLVIPPCACHRILFQKKPGEPYLPPISWLCGGWPDFFGKDRFLTATWWCMVCVVFLRICLLAQRRFSKDARIGAIPGQYFSKQLLPWKLKVHFQSICMNKTVTWSGYARDNLRRNF